MYEVAYFDWQRSPCLPVILSFCRSTYLDDPYHSSFDDRLLNVQLFRLVFPALKGYFYIFHIPRGLGLGSQNSHKQVRSQARYERGSPFANMLFLKRVYVFANDCHRQSSIPYLQDRTKASPTFSNRICLQKVRLLSMQSTLETICKIKVSRSRWVGILAA